ncbi:MAG: GatB/YqeY domain-containing protein [Nannocystaceae bacterium]|nr:GatB/YqeY domain-containing protein [bacterium]
MPVREKIMEKFKQARRERDDATKNVIAMLRTKVQNELKSGKGREEDDALWTEVVTAYAKQVGKTIVELEKAGERAGEALEEAKFELAFCQQFLPKKLDEAATEALVRDTIAKVGVSSPKEMGKLMGALMKDHKDELDGSLARQLATKILSES